MGQAVMLPLERAGQNAVRITGDEHEFSKFCPLLLIMEVFSLGCVCCVTFPKRTQLRKKYGLRPAPCHDCLVHILTPCAICQEARELKYQEEMLQNAGTYTPPRLQKMWSPPLWPSLKLIDQGGVM